MHGRKLTKIRWWRLTSIGAIVAFEEKLDGLAWSGASLIPFLCLQRLCAALVSLAALSKLATTFEEGRERNRALRIWLSWSWIFFVKVPVGALVIAI